jgi:lipopolysaccharide/colanic/teichoic acid biosynthesis glycosyltransferase
LSKARPLRIKALSIAAVLLGFIFLLAAYAIAAAGPDFWVALTDNRRNHIFTNAAATLAVGFWSLRIAGRVDRKIAEVFRHVVFIHGGLAFIILISRNYYSIKIMLTAFAMSVALGLLVMFSRHVRSRPNIALLGHRHPLISQINYPIDVILDPSIPLTKYDIILTSDILDTSPEWSGPMDRAMLLGKQIRHVAEFTEDVQGIVSIDHFDLEQISVARMEAYRFGKRLLDILLVVVAVPLAAPLLMLGMCMVLIKMGRPIFFVQPRVGLGGQPFQMYKLRTMRIANHAEGVRATSSGDSRVTKVGKILRRFRIDELPQLLNVLKGDMSVIGPRPEQPMLTQEYERELPAFVYRSLVRPGITGWAQVRAGYAANLEETRVKLTYDLFYIKNFSFALDMQILFRTIWTLASGVGAR